MTMRITKLGPDVKYGSKRPAVSTESHCRADSGVRARKHNRLAEGDTMAAELRQTGIRLVGDVPWGTHFCHFYETKEDLLDILVPYFKAGLENNESCVWVVS